MAILPTRSCAIANTLAVVAAACAVSPAYAAISLPVDYWDQWSSDLLYGSIALLVAGVLAKMFTYRNGGRDEVARHARSDGGVAIGTYRNKVLSPDN